MHQVATVESPNIIFIFTDDQDAASLSEMPYTNRMLGAKGTTFENATFAQPQCCPSRVTMLRGQYPHNSGITENADGAVLFRQKGLDDSTVATWLDEAGYKTALIGKYLNDYEDETPYIPPGWDRWFAGLDGVWADCFNDNGQRRCYVGHPDTVIKKKALGFVRNNAPAERPFFLLASFSAPHYRAFYAKQDADKFQDAPLRKPPSFNEKNVSDKPEWVRSLPRLKDREVAEMRAFHRDRLRSLQTVDRAVRSLVKELWAKGELDNTYIFFWTDNGHHLGEHRLPAGKNTPYLEDQGFPLIVRGPGVSENRSRPELVLNTDLGPTMADLAGAQPPEFVDGRSFAALLRGESIPWRDAVLIEGRANEVMGIPAYTGVRTASGEFYVEYATGERELYDLEEDPHQLHNLLRCEESADPGDLPERLDALRRCAGKECIEAEGP